MFKTATFYIRFNDDLSCPKTMINSDGTQTVEADHLYSFTSDGQATGTGASDGSTPADPSHSIAIGDTITTNDYEFTLTAADLTYELLPSDVSSVYTSYPADSGKVFVHIAADLKNLMKRDIRIEETFSAKAIYAGEYTYSGFVVVEDGNSFDWVSSYSAATPLETAKMHALMECPTEVDQSAEPLKILITLSDGVEYEYTLR